MIIAGARIEPFTLALRRPLSTARGRITERRGFLLHVTSADGVGGCGEASPAYWLGEETLARTAAGLERLVGRLARRPRLATVREQFDADALGLSPAVACALDGALLDLEARERGMGVAALFGADPGAVVTAAALVGGSTADAAGADAANAVARGFGAVKLKVGVAPLADEVTRIAAVRARVGTVVRLRLDANRAWTTAEAGAALDALAPYGIEYVEEPLRGFDPVALAMLTGVTGVPVAVDESLRSSADLGRLLAAGARVHVVLKAARLGGMSRLVALARQATQAGLPVVVTDAIESRVGIGVAVHAAAVVAARGAVPAAVGLGGAQLVAAAAALRTPELGAVGPGYDVAPVAARGEAETARG
ncbi:MAG: o-succinylbenzoate synthase [Polyangiaceae bacterium UTPRO1]|nr:o-succinylbenzoate synthase [Myxococcales bacterium]OQY68136.1 MAG: o-succinylbenzoate synthase [Polyangiaceae bacterium UTPRO1]